MTVQAADRRREKLEADPAALVLVDEVHMGGAASQYRRVLDCAPDAVAIGFTGTPRPETFDVLPAHVPGRDADWLTANGFLSPLRYVCPSRPELDQAKIRRGEYDPADLLDAINARDICGDAIQSYRRWCAGRPTLLFAIHVKHAEAVAGEFRAAGIACEVLTGKDTADETERKLEWIRQGGLLLAVDKVSAGFDLPDLHAIISLRPTKSPQLWVQQMGRVARVKEHGGPGWVIDHSGNTLRLGTLNMERDWRERDPESEKDTQTADGEILAVRQCENCLFIWDTPGLSVCPSCGEDCGRDQRISKREKIHLDEVEAAEIERQHQAAKAARKAQREQCGIDLKQMTGMLSKKRVKEARKVAIYNMRQRLDRALRDGDKVVEDFARAELKKARVDLSRPNVKPGEKKPATGLDGWPL